MGSNFREFKEGSAGRREPLSRSMIEEEVTPTTQTLFEHAEFLRGICRSILTDEHLAEDVAQETIASALGRRTAPLRRPRAWLAAVARNLARRAVRTRERVRHRELAAARPEGVPSASENATRLETQRRVLEAVESLPEPSRAVVILRYFDGVGPAEIARRLDVPVRTVESRLRRARTRIRERLLADFGGEDRAFRSALLLALPGPVRGSCVGTAAGVASLLGGVAVMTLKTKLLLGGAAVLLLGGVLWTTLTPPAPSRLPAPDDVLTTTPSAPRLEEDPAAAAGTVPPDRSNGQVASETGARAKAEELPSTGCHGTIRYEDGTPVADAPVRLAPGAPEAVGRTDDQGRYRFRVAAIPFLVRYLLLLTEDGGTAHLNLGQVPLRPGEDIEANFEIPRGHALTIEVRGPDRQTKPGVQLNLKPEGKGVAGSAFALTGSDGRISLPWLGPGPYVVEAAPSGCRPFRGSVEPARLPAGSVYRIDLSSVEDLLLAFEGWSGGVRTSFLLVLTPLSGRPPGGPFRWSASLDAEGTWTGSAPPAGDYGVWVRVAGRVMTMERLTVPTQGPCEVRFASPGGVEATGYLLSSSGTPVKGARVYFLNREPPPLSLSAVTAEDGSFRVGPLRPGRYQVDAMVGDTTLKDLVPEGVEVRPAGESNLAIHLPEMGKGSIAGSLVGFPAATGAVPRRVLILREGPSGHRRWGVTRVDAVGTFYVGGLPPGRYRLEVRAIPVVGARGSGSTEVELGVGERKPNVVIRAEETPAIRLHLKRPGGEPFAGGAVATATAVGREESVLLRLVPDEEGRCSVSSLRAGRWRLTFLGGPKRLLTVEIEVPERPGGPIEIVLW